MTPKKKVREPIVIVVISETYSNQPVLAERLAKDLFFDYVDLDASDNGTIEAVQFPGIVFKTVDERKIFVKADITLRIISQIGERSPDSGPGEFRIITGGLTADEVYVQMLKVCARKFAEMVANQ